MIIFSMYITLPFGGESWISKIVIDAVRIICTFWDGINWRYSPYLSVIETFFMCLFPNLGGRANRRRHSVWQISPSCLTSSSCIVGAPSSSE